MKYVQKYQHYVVLLLYVCGVLYITHPLIFHLGDFITGFGDELLIAWIHNWVVHSLLTNPFDIFNANIYYPYGNSLAYSDFFLITSILGYIPFLFTDQPVTFINFTILSSLVFLAYSIYLLSFHITKDIKASFLSGLLVMFSPAVLDKFVHIQILAIAFVPLSILFFILFLQTKKDKFLIISLLCFVLQTLNSFLPGYFIIFSLCILSFFYCFFGKKRWKIFQNKKRILVIIISFILLIPATIPYFTVSHEFNYVRDIRETIHLSLQPEDYFYTNHYSRFDPVLSMLQPKDNYPHADFKPGFIGIAFTILVIFACVYFMRHYKKKEWVHNALFSIATFGFIMSLGPFLHLFRSTIHNPFPIPLPYAFFYYSIPGFQGIRNSSRWEMLFIIAIAVVIAIVLHKALKRLAFRKQLIIYSILIIVTIAEFNYPLHFERVPQKKEFPQVYNWLNTISKDSVIIEMPIYTWDMQPYVFDENMREYYATVHFRKMVNGASGFSPPPWQKMTRELLSSFPNDNSLAAISSLGVDYIIVHVSEYEALCTNNFEVDSIKLTRCHEIISTLNEHKNIKFVKKFGNDYVYQIIQ